MGVAEARDAARRLIEGGGHSRGDDVTSATFAVLAEQFLDHGVSRRGKPLRPATMAAYRIVLRSYAKPLHGRPVESIRRRDIAELLRVIARDNGKATASLARSVLSRFFGYLVEVDVVEANPAHGTPVLSIEPRSRVFSDVELAALWAATEDPSDFSMIVRSLLWTGCRRSEAAGMRWSELHGDNVTMIWTIPGSRTKNHRELVLPLPRQMVAALAGWRRIVGRDHLFGATSQVGFKSWVQKDRLADPARLRPAMVAPRLP